MLHLHARLGESIFAMASGCTHGGAVSKLASMRRPVPSPSGNVMRHLRAGIYALDRFALKIIQLGPAPVWSSYTGYVIFHRPKALSVQMTYANQRWVHLGSGYGSYLLDIGKASRHKHIKIFYSTPTPTLACVFKALLIGWARQRCPATSSSYSMNRSGNSGLGIVGVLLGRFLQRYSLVGKSRVVH